MKRLLKVVVAVVAIGCLFGVGISTGLAFPAYPDYVSSGAEWEEWSNQAIEWAMDCKEDPECSSGYYRRCLAFVGDAFIEASKELGRENPGLAGWPSPEDAISILGDSFYAGDTNPPTGALVFFSALGEDEPYGHVGICLGDNRVIHAYGHMIRDDDLAVVESLDRIDSYLGWAYPPEQWFGSTPASIEGRWVAEMTEEDAPQSVELELEEDGAAVLTAIDRGEWGIVEGDELFLNLLGGPSYTTGEISADTIILSDCQSGSTLRKADEAEVIMTTPGGRVWSSYVAENTEPAVSGTLDFEMGADNTCRAILTLTGRWDIPESCCVEIHMIDEHGYESEILTLDAVDDKLVDRESGMVFVPADGTVGMPGGDEETKAQVMKMGEPAPDFSAVTIDGQNIKLSEFIGDKPVVLDFFATWCGPCMIELPLLQEFYAANSDKLVIIAISIEDVGAADKIRAAIQEKGITFPVIHDSDKTISSMYPTNAIPYLVFIDKGGMVIHTQLGSDPNTGNTVKEKFGL